MRLKCTLLLDHPSSLPLKIFEGGFGSFWMGRLDEFVNAFADYTLESPLLSNRIEPYNNIFVTFNYKIEYLIMKSKHMSSYHLSPPQKMETVSNTWKWELKRAL